MAKACALSTGYLPRGGLPRNSVARITDRPDMTSAVDRGRKASTQTNKKTDKHGNLYCGYLTRSFSAEELCLIIEILDLETRQMTLNNRGADQPGWIRS